MEDRDLNMDDFCCEDCGELLEFCDCDDCGDYCEEDFIGYGYSEEEWKMDKIMAEYENTLEEDTNVK